MECEGEYYPLQGSGTTASKPTGMSTAEENWLHDQQQLFQKPDSRYLLASGFGKEWPHARGVLEEGLQKGL